MCVQCPGQRAGPRGLRAAGVCEGLLLRARGPYGGPVCAAPEGSGVAQQRRLLAPARHARAHGRDRPHRAQDPLAEEQRRGRQRVRQAEVGPALGRGGQELKLKLKLKLALARNCPAKHMIITRV